MEPEKYILLLPAVPREIKSILNNPETQAYLSGISGTPQHQMTFKVFKTLGLSESKIDEYGSMNKDFVKKIAKMVKEKEQVDICLCVGGLALDSVLKRCCRKKNNGLFVWRYTPRVVW